MVRAHHKVKNYTFLFFIIIQSYFKGPKDVRLNLTYSFILNISRQASLQIAFSHLSYLDFKYFLKIYKKFTAKSYSSLVNDTISPSDDPMQFRKVSQKE